MIEEEIIPWNEKPSLKQFTFRSTIVGLFIGSIVLMSNFQFGLQTGWVSMMSLPAALLGFSIFKVFSKNLSYPFTDAENVFVQSVAVAVGTGPLAYGLVGIIPSIEKFLTIEESGYDFKLQFSTLQLIYWSTGLAFFGIFFAIPLRKQVIIKEKLPFPSGSATATLISVLHNTELYEESDEVVQYNDAKNRTSANGNLINSENHENSSNYSNLIDNESLLELKKTETYNKNFKNLLITFCVSSFYTIIAHFFPILRNLPVFGRYLSKNYLWNIQPSPAYIGQGIIMGLPTVSYMLFGSILGWGILAPLSKEMGWAPGEINDWKTGGQGWILWISLSVMISDSVIGFLVISSKMCFKFYKKISIKRSNYNHGNDDGNDGFESESLLQRTVLNDDDNNNENENENEVSEKYLVSNKTTIIGLIGSCLLCLISIRLVFPNGIIPVYSILIAVILALFLSILGVRALGETDLNPVSGIGKLSQIIFAIIIPKDRKGTVLINLVAGGIAEAGAQQAGDLMQDLKTGHLIGASPKAQFIAQVIGTIWSIFLSSVMYKVYNHVYDIPNDLFRIPTAVIWIDCSRLVTGKGLPPYSRIFCMIFGLVFGVISLIKNIIFNCDFYKQTKDSDQYYYKVIKKNLRKIEKYIIYIPSGIAVGIGIYNTPNFTIARFIGGLVVYIWMQRVYNDNDNDSDSNNDTEEIQNKKISMIIFSSGLILGEGLFSIFSMVLTSLGA
ncbi:uncharacterized protein ASCRUDRAFT_39812 [Ascoidea rubescens DSM 1968]|uniref:Putative oligopeptide transporter YGL114W n=1 Tax=Ascoidea rubescens DSM 1968 TaxID=1344418 RepID=A0A1D2V908_9ASCO|nr:putative oligopeptide transporter YGL114W [Ascoidea rubescens DSM 1968]ODV58130.1 putative oligopeptide transporter YGL114W [Ascoidea rubescens DSM 1968]